MRTLLVAIAYGIESLVSAMRLGAWGRHSWWFLVWDTLLVALPFSALWAWQQGSRLRVVLAAVGGSVCGATIGLLIG